MRKKSKLTQKQKQVFFLGIPASMRRKSDWLFGYTIYEVPADIKVWYYWSITKTNAEEKRWSKSVVKLLEKFKGKEEVNHIKVIFSFTGDEAIDVNYYFAWQEVIIQAIQDTIKCSANLHLEYMLKFGEKSNQTNILIK